MKTMNELLFFWSYVFSSSSLFVSQYKARRTQSSCLVTTKCTQHNISCEKENRFYDYPWYNGTMNQIHSPRETFKFPKKIVFSRPHSSQFLSIFFPPKKVSVCQFFSPFEVMNLRDNYTRLFHGTEFWERHSGASHATREV